MLESQQEPIQTRRDPRAVDGNASRSLDPHYIARRQAERELALHPHTRVAPSSHRTIPRRKSSAGLQSEPHHPLPTSSSSAASSPEYSEILKLRNELAQLKFDHNQLQELIKVRTRMAEADQKKCFDQKKFLLNVIQNLKKEVEEGWNRVIRLKKTYEELEVTLQAQSHRRYPSDDVSKSMRVKPSSKRVSFSYQSIERPSKPLFSDYIPHNPIDPRHRPPSLHDFPSGFNRGLGVDRGPIHFPTSSGHFHQLPGPSLPTPTHSAFNPTAAERSRRTSFS